MKFRDFAKILTNNGFNIEWTIDDPTRLFIYYDDTLCGSVSRCVPGDYSIVNMRSVPSVKAKKAFHDAIFEYSLTPTNDREEWKMKIQFGE